MAHGFNTFLDTPTQPRVPPARGRAAVDAPGTSPHLSVPLALRFTPRSRDRDIPCAIPLRSGGRRADNADNLCEQCPMAIFLFKTEPTTYSFDDLAREEAAVWDGITNAQAINFLRDARAGDEALIYHSGDEKAIVGLAKITSSARADPGHPQLDAQGRHKRIVVGIKALTRLPKAVTLAQVKADKRFAEFLLVRNSRLSVMPVPAAIDRLIRQWAGL